MEKTKTEKAMEEDIKWFSKFSLEERLKITSLANKSSEALKLMDLNPELLGAINTFKSINSK